MKTAMMIKEVDFSGDTLIAIQEGNTIYTAVKKICEYIDLSRGQTNNEIAKVQSDAVLNQGARNLMLPTAGGEQSTICLMIDFLPLWLAKIRITPAMKQNNPKLAEKLIQYQLKAKDVLAAAFLPAQTNKPTAINLLLNNLNENQRILAEEVQRIEGKIEKHIKDYQFENADIREGLLSIGYDLSEYKQKVENLCERTSSELNEKDQRISSLDKDLRTQIFPKPLRTKRERVFNKIVEDYFPEELKQKVYQEALSDIRSMNISTMRQKLTQICWHDWSRDFTIKKYDEDKETIFNVKYTHKPSYNWAFYIISTVFLYLYYDDADLLKRMFPSNYKPIKAYTYHIDNVWLGLKATYNRVVEFTRQKENDYTVNVTVKDYIIAREVAHRIAF